MSVGLNNFLVGSDALGDLGVLEESHLGLGNLSLALVECFSLDLPLGFKSGDDVLVFPADLRKEHYQ